MQSLVCADMQLKKYQEVMASISKQNMFSGDANPDANEASMIEEATKQLMTTVKSVPELRAQKKKLDSHMNLLYALLQKIKSRALDKYNEVGEKVLSGAGPISRHRFCEFVNLHQRTTTTQDQNFRYFILQRDTLRPEDMEHGHSDCSKQRDGVHLH